MKYLKGISGDELPTLTVRQIVGRLRHQWASWPRKFAAIHRHSVRVQLPSGRYKTLIRCSRCADLFAAEAIEAHHTKPVGKLSSNAVEDVSAYMKRLFCAVRDITPLCRFCHLIVSKQQLKEFKNDNNQIHTAEPSCI